MYVCFTLINSNCLYSLTYAIKTEFKRCKIYQPTKRKVAFVINYGPIVDVFYINAVTNIIIVDKFVYKWS